MTSKSDYMIYLVKEPKINFMFDKELTHFFKKIQYLNTWHDDDELTCIQSKIFRLDNINFYGLKNISKQKVSKIQKRILRHMSYIKVLQFWKKNKCI